MHSPTLKMYTECQVNLILSQAATLYVQLYEYIKILDTLLPSSKCNALRMKFLRLLRVIRLASLLIWNQKVLSILPICSVLSRLQQVSISGPCFLYNCHNSGHYPSFLRLDSVSGLSGNYSVGSNR
jgi:hypothetical protein